MHGAYLLPPASLLDDVYDRALILGGADESTAIIPPAKQMPLYLWYDNGDVLCVFSNRRIDMSNRWAVTLFSTSESAYRVCSTFRDPSTNPQRDLRCATLAGSVAVIGTGRCIHIVEARKSGVDVGIDWKHHSLTFSSDVIDVCARGLLLLVGLRSGRIQSVVLSRKPRIGRSFSFQSSGAVTAIRIANHTEFVAAYTNGDVRSC